MRPGLREFLEIVIARYEVIVWTASTSEVRAWRVLCYWLCVCCFIVAVCVAGAGCVLLAVCVWRYSCVYVAGAKCVLW